MRISFIVQNQLEMWSMFKLRINNLLCHASKQTFSSSTIREQTNTNNNITTVYTETHYHSTAINRINKTIYVVKISQHSISTKH